jgi:serine/threonine protein kinase
MIVHNDIKFENILCPLPSKIKTFKNSIDLIKLCDFAISEKVNFKRPNDSENKLFTEEYCPPEMLFDEIVLNPYT